MSKHYTSLISLGFGKFAGASFFPLLQYIINSSYISLMGLDMSEFGKPCDYKSLNKLFTRPLNNPREMPEDSSVIISPADSLVSDYGKIEEGNAYQIKGMSYPLDELLGSEYSSEALEGGAYINLYLSPRDYHRYHIPMDMGIKSLTHIPGKLYPVNFPLLKNKKNLFIENERVVIECEDSSGNIHFLVLVGALNVGKMVVVFEPAVNTNSDIIEPRHYTYKELNLKRGELLGWFEMGSTILMFSPKGTTLSEVAINRKVRFGDSIGRRV
jgi:phosphatidylserine decarboxylase